MEEEGEEDFKSDAVSVIEAALNMAEGKRETQKGAGDGSRRREILAGRNRVCWSSEEITGWLWAMTNGLAWLGLALLGLAWLGNTCAQTCMG